MTDIEKLVKAGYKIRSDQYGYSVYLNGVFINGAGVLDTTKKMHWQHAKANRKMFSEQAWGSAEKHFQENSQES